MCVKCMTRAKPKSANQAQTHPACDAALRYVHQLLVRIRLPYYTNTPPPDDVSHKHPARTRRRPAARGPRAPHMSPSANTQTANTHVPAHLLMMGSHSASSGSTWSEGRPIMEAMGSWGRPDYSTAPDSCKLAATHREISPMSSELHRKGRSRAAPSQCKRSRLCSQAPQAAIIVLPRPSWDQQSRHGLCSQAARCGSAST